MSGPGDPSREALFPGDAQAPEPRVLFVDDDAYMRRLMTARLAHLGAQVETAPGAPAALSFLESHRPDLIVLDAVMPGMDGFDLCRRLKGDPLLQSIPVVILTAVARDLRQRSLAAGADDYLSKLDQDVLFRLRFRLAYRLALRLAGGADDPPATAPATLLAVSASRAVPAQLGTHLLPVAVQVEEAATLDEALARLQGWKPDLLALDLALGPDHLDGWLAQLRGLPHGADLPVLALATKGEEPWLAGLEPLIQDRLLKPLDGHESRHRVRHLLRVARVQGAC